MLQKFLKIVNSASAKEFIERLPQKEIPVPALLLKAKACYYIGLYELGIVTIDEILKRKVGKAERAEAYRYRADIINKINDNDDEKAWENLKKASLLGDKIAQDHLHNINYKKKKDKR